jgi:hypothetical protein
VAGEGSLGEEMNGNLSCRRSRFFKDRSAIGYRYMAKKFQKTVMFDVGIDQ